MYRALVERDSTFEGVFFAGVKTTGIFCRPTCPAKKPKEGHVEFFVSPHDALFAGYRPCKRCNPSESSVVPPPLVLKLRELVEADPLARIKSGDLRKMGIDPSTARRQFQRYYGMTFAAYHRARRMGMALHEVRKGERVIGAQLDSGYDSASGFYDAFKQVFGTPPSKGSAVQCLYSQWLETPLGPMIAIAGDDGLHLLEFIDRRALEREILMLRKRRNVSIVPGTNKHLKAISTELKEYFAGKRTGFTVPLLPAGSPFEESVWKNLRKIPHGATWSYARLAEKVGKPKATRAVGSANGRNCLAIVIPCHRVIRADGSLSGYGGGVWRKQRLIDLEKGVG